MNLLNTHCISYPRTILSKPGAPPDVEEQLRNTGRTKLRDMSDEAIAVFQETWDPAVDGALWPPRGDSVLMGFPE